MTALHWAKKLLPAIDHHNVVVDAETRVIKIFMDTTDVHPSSILQGEFGRPLVLKGETGTRLSFIGAVQFLIQAVGTASVANGKAPKNDW